MWLKINSKLKMKIIKYLDIDKQYMYTMERINEHESMNKNQFSTLYNSIDSNNKYIKTNISHLQESIKILHNTMENVVHIGTDVRENHNNREHSWAVICVEGKINIVKFLDLNRNDSRYVLDFLKQFEAGRHCIDSPRKELFYEEMFKF